MKKLKERVIDIISKGNEKIGQLNKSIEKIKETPMYTEEYKLEVVAERNQEILTIRNQVDEDVKKVFDEEIERISNENNYKDSNSTETANILKMIELIKNNITEAEIKHLFNIYDDNNIVKRVLLAIAESRDMNIEGEKYIPDIAKLERVKQQLSGAIQSTGTDGIESIKLELLFRSME